MEEVAGHGRTVLFVSHNMNNITRLCTRSILLNGGRLVADGPPADITHLYLHSDEGTTAARSWTDPAAAPGNHVVRLRSVRACDDHGQTQRVADIRSPVDIEIVYDVLEDGHVLVPCFQVQNEDGICLFYLSDQHDPDWRRRPRPRGTYTATARIPGNFLAEGLMIVTVMINTWFPAANHVWERDVIAFQVVDSQEGDTARGDYAGHYPGVVRPVFPWNTRHQLPADPAGSA
jgi:lipopolysaccharide transport system ATP-binding protein